MTNQPLRKVTVMTSNQGAITCHFHGFFQMTDDDGAMPVAVIEMPDGGQVTLPVNAFKFNEPPKDESSLIIL